MSEKEEVAISRSPRRVNYDYNSWIEKVETTTKNEPWVLYYFAGFLDGEGYVGISHQSRQYYLIMNIVNTNKDVIEFLVKKLGGKMRYYERPPPQKDVYLWYPSWGYHAYYLLSMLKDYLVVKKPQAYLAIKFYEYKENPVIPKSYSKVEKRYYYYGMLETFYKMMRALNKKGKSDTEVDLDLVFRCKIRPGQNFLCFKQNQPIVGKKYLRGNG